jgi:inorganic pyrophosphatase
VRRYRAPFFVLLVTILIGCAAQTSAPPAIEQDEAQDPYTFAGPANFLTDFPPESEDGSIRVVVEIPAGTNQKWEVTKPEGVLRREFRNGEPRVVRYLSYPANYGMIPRTLLPEEAGGDGDPLDVVVLGEAVPRGSVIDAKLIGVLRLLDDGEQDDKLIAVRAGTPLYEVDDIDQLDRSFNGVSAILEIWFSNYKGPGEIVSRGFAGVDEARAILDAAVSAFEDHQALEPATR